MSKSKESVNELLVEVFNQILSIEERWLKERGVKLSMTEVHVLEAIQNTDVATMTNVSTKLRVTIGTLTTSISTLVRKGFVERKRGEEDKRIVNLKLTESASDVLKIHSDFHDQLINNVFKDLKIEEDEVLVKSLERVSEYFKNHY